MFDLSKLGPTRVCATCGWSFFIDAQTPPDRNECMECEMKRTGTIPVKTEDGKAITLVMEQ